MLTGMLIVLLMAFSTDGKDVNSSMWNAVKKGDADKVKVLIKQGADINAQDEDGDTPLMIASYYGQLEVVRALLNAGADVSSTHKYGGTALISAAAGGHVQILKALIEKGAEVNAKTYDGRTPLMLTAMNYGAPRVEIINTLLAGGADINAKDMNGYTALMYAVDFPPPPPMPPPDSRAELNTQFEKNQMAVGSQREVIKALLAGGADVQAKADDGNTALMIAEHYGQAEIIRMLKQAGTRK